MKRYRIALIPGDGVGKEVVPAAVKVLEAAAQGFTLSFQAFDWGCEYCLETGRIMPDDNLEQLHAFDAILLNAINMSAIQTNSSHAVPNHLSLRDLLLRIRFSFD